MTVKRINKEVDDGKKPDLNPHGKRLLGVGNPKHSHSINATSGKVSPSEGDRIQRLGNEHGCHSCGTRYPKDSYHADHCPPVCYTYSHVINILKYAAKNIASLKDIEITNKFELRPQCPRCSHEQGGKMNEISRRAKVLAKALTFAVYS